jgi:hypothetical protein
MTKFKSDENLGIKYDFFFSLKKKKKEYKNGPYDFSVYMDQM